MQSEPEFSIRVGTGRKCASTDTFDILPHSALQLVFLSRVRRTSEAVVRFEISRASGLPRAAQILRVHSLRLALRERSRAGQVK
jgi:hypothetical protein